MSSSTANDKEKAPASNFLRQIIEADLAQSRFLGRHWAGSPGDAAHQATGPADPAKIRTRFPPEPNGYLHVGHAKSICLNFGLARDYGGVCHMRFDDTNPEKEDTEYVRSILDAVQWLGFSWEAEFNGQRVAHLYQASDYFAFMYRAAEHLIESGGAYVDEQTPDEMRIRRGDFSNPGVNSPYRERSPAENLARFREMRDGQHADGAMVLRAKIDMAHPNINMRDPAIYRIKHAHHHHTGDAWCIYPMYTFAHPIEDALENITHSICTLEFEDQRPFYDWLMDKLVQGGLVQAPPPRQYEFARLNLSHVLTSKRKLKTLVDAGHVAGWDDPRMPTIVGLRRRGYTPESIRLFCERIGVSKADSWIDYSSLEIALRDDLDPKAARAMAVLDPIKLVVTNFPAGQTTDHSAPVHPQDPDRGLRHFQFGQELWIERDDFQAIPEKGYHRLYPPHTAADGKAVPGSMVRLKYGYVVQCSGFKTDAEGRVTEVQAEYFPESKSGTPTSSNYKAKGVITWVACANAATAEVRLYDRLFTDPQPDAGGKDYLQALNPHSLRVVTAYVEPSLAKAQADDKYQFERHGYFVADRKDHAPDRWVFNRVTGLKDSWGR